MRRRRKPAGFLASHNLVPVTVAILTGVGSWLDGRRKSDEVEAHVRASRSHLSERVDANAALSVNTAAQVESLQAVVKALGVRLARVEHRRGQGRVFTDTIRVGPVYGPEVKPEGWKQPGLLKALSWLTPWARKGG